MVKITFQVLKQTSLFTNYKQDTEKTLEISAICKTDLRDNLNKLQGVSFSRHVKILLKNKMLVNWTFIRLSITKNFFIPLVQLLC